MSNDYRFLARWRLRGSPEEVATVLSDAQDLPRWWPSVYLDVQVVEDGDAQGIGREVELWTKGWLPYTLRWRFTTLRNDGPGGISLRADGDFVGGGTWIFVKDGDYVNLLRLADPRREAAAPPLDLADAARVQCQPPLGDAQGRGQHASRARPAPSSRRLRRPGRLPTRTDLRTADSLPTTRRLKRATQPPDDGSRMKR